MKALRIRIQLKPISLYLISFLLLTGTLEVLLRIDFITSKWVAPSFGSDHHQFEIQLSRIKSLYRQQGKVECIFVGDSLTWLDIEPLSFVEGYKTKTGQDIQCFNFGIAGLPASGVSVITGVLNKEYNPKLIVYGLHANSVVVAQDAEDTKIVLDTPWVKYKTGNFNLAGWLYENSYFVRNLNILGRLMRFDKETFQNELGTQPYQLLGFDPKVGQRTDVNLLPSRYNDADIGGFEKYYNYQVYQENILGIQKIANLADYDTSVVMVMMPVHESFYAFFENSEQDYLQLTETIQQALNDVNSDFIDAGHEFPVPDKLWWDYSHMNFNGSKEFSYWLGVTVGNLHAIP